MEDLINTNWERLMDDHCHFSRLTRFSKLAIDCIDESTASISKLAIDCIDTRLKSSEIWVMNDQMDIQV